MRCHHGCITAVTYVVRFGFVCVVRGRDVRRGMVWRGGGVRRSCAVGGAGGVCHHREVTPAT